jgi:cytochrome c553
MRNKLVIGTIALAFSAAAMMAADAPPPWAYGYATAMPAPGTPPPAPAAAPAAPDTSLKSLPGATGQFTRQQIANRNGPADWFPGDHPTMPDVVAHGKAPNVFACSLCHYPNGKGRAENAPVSGLPVSYFIQTMHDFKDDNRKSTDDRKANTKLMAQFAKNMTDDEIKAAAEYFGAMKWTPWIEVVEASMVPKTRIQGGLFLALEGNEKEPIAGRIIEVPKNAEATEVLRDPHSGFIAYVPPGSLKKGMALVTKGEGKTTECALCHGADLKGVGPVPGIAGRSPSYLMRQLYDMQNGTRKGVWTPLMVPVVSKLSTMEMQEIVAYVASLKP